jgi:hypothetical protein
VNVPVSGFRFPGAWRWGRHSILTLSYPFDLKNDRTFAGSSSSCNLCEGGISDPLHQQVLRIYSHKSQKGSRVTCKIWWFISRFDMLRAPWEGLILSLEVLNGVCFRAVRLDLCHHGHRAETVAQRAHAGQRSAPKGAPKADPKIMLSIVF